MTGAPTTLQIKVTLDGSRPPIWRRLVVSGSATLDELHRVLQVAMGWEDYHLHCFRIGGVRYGPADYEDFDMDEVDEKTVTIAEAFADERRGVYDYDFGDSWEHRLLVEKTDVPVAWKGVALCTGGKRACPPEDCGGVWGYYNLLEALGDPSHEEHEEYLEWVGEDFDSEDFSKDAVNAVLERLG
ncbi:MAG: plasmid pRiA4b ORF-3 family protein [Acidimicrobiales bacterium]